MSSYASLKNPYGSLKIPRLQGLINLKKIFKKSMFNGSYKFFRMLIKFTFLGPRYLRNGLLPEKDNNLKNCLKNMSIKNRTFCDNFF